MAFTINREEELKTVLQKGQNRNQKQQPEKEGGEEEHEEEAEKGTPLRYVPLCDLYSATSPCGGSTNVMSKKVKARKLVNLMDDNAEDNDNVEDNNNNVGDDDGEKPSNFEKPPLIHFYTRRRKKALIIAGSNSHAASSVDVKPEIIKEVQEEEEEEDRLMQNKKKKRKLGHSELINLGVDSSVLLDRPRLRESRHQFTESQNQRRKKNSNIFKISSSVNNNNDTNKTNSCITHDNDDTFQNDAQMANNSGSVRTKRWVRLSFNGVDPEKFIGLHCQVYWPLDADWYSGKVVGYNPETDRHNVEYEDDDEESLVLANERIKFHISPEEMQRLKLNYCLHSSDTDGLDVDEMVAFAASLDDYHELEPGDIIWAKVTGHAMWPAIVLDESHVGDRKGLKKISGEKSLPVQFFGTHDFARVRTKQVISFLKGLLSSFHLKCKKPDFQRSLEEAKMYLSEQKFPKRMLLQRSSNDGDCESTSDQDDGNADLGLGDDEGIQKKLEGFKHCPLEIGDLQVISLGKIVKGSNFFQDERFVCPEGYTAMRQFPSITDPSVCTLYKMEVLRDNDSKTRPLFSVTSDNGEQFKGSTPSACWDKIYKRIRKMQVSTPDGLRSADASRKKSGSDMFGFSHPEVLKLIQELSSSKHASKLFKLTSGRYQDLPVGYRPVHVKWKDLDKCNVCHMDEEYENNLFLQCDKCRMMVHARCYGEFEPVDGKLWLCNLCRPGAPEFPPPCCLCPLIGGAMKPTTDGRWAHLACAIWIPETCLSDVKKMEPIDGLSRINKDRWKLLCSICGVSYGACIQCSNNNCYVAYHPLCARAAGFCAELEDEDRLHLIPVDEDEENQCIRLLSFCKKHRPASSNERLVVVDEQIASQCSDYSPPPNPSGCARGEPYNYFGRRGRKEPEALAAASLKRLFVENRPYLVGGYCQHGPLGNTLSSNNTLDEPRSSFILGKLSNSELDACKTIVSMAEKYRYMRKTFRSRLAFGKSGIHGFGIFAKQPHRAGDMVIEYTGELVRPRIADRREHLIYNSLVGAGTYMFRIDDERVIDATRAGSIAHLINHSCEPNCYSRVISVNGDEHIIIFAKRDIKEWEELTYDYRHFFQLMSDLGVTVAPQDAGV
ncbi:hypothetical protein LguiA_029773 [Lonicera macranthoides]